VSNPVAALPSLHSAFPVLIALFLRGIKRWLTALSWIYAAAMAVALVYAGEHFVFDTAMGWSYAFATYAVVQVAYARLRTFRQAYGERRRSRLVPAET